MKKKNCRIKWRLNSLTNCYNLPATDELLPAVTIFLTNLIFKDYNVLYVTKWPMRRAALLIPWFEQEPEKWGCNYVPDLRNISGSPLKVKVFSRSIKHLAFYYWDSKSLSPQIMINCRIKWWHNFLTNCYYMPATDKLLPVVITF